MIDTQLLNDALMTVALMLGLVVLISAWVVTASALHWRHTTRAEIRTIEEHLAHIAEQSPTPVR